MVETHIRDQLIVRCGYPSDTGHQLIKPGKGRVGGRMNECDHDGFLYDSRRHGK